MKKKVIVSLSWFLKEKREGLIIVDVINLFQFLKKGGRNVKSLKKKWLGTCMVIVDHLPCILTFHSLF